MLNLFSSIANTVLLAGYFQKKQLDGKMKQLFGTDKTWPLVKQDVNNGTKDDEWNSLLNFLAAKMVSAKKMDQKNWIHFCSLQIENKHI